MDELVGLVAQKTGMPPEQARTAVETVLGFLKTKLPEPIASQIDGLVGSSGGSGITGNLPGGLGGLLGRR
jgi:hypothetical protein